MQIVILLLIMGLFAHDGLRDATASQPAGFTPLLWLAPQAALAGLYWLTCAAAAHNLPRRGERAVQLLDRATGMYRGALLGLYFGGLWMGALAWVRQTTGRIVLLDEIIFLLPTLGLIVFAWWAYYPIERRLREAALIRRLDAGQPLPPMWTRGQFVLSQFRHQVALVLAPMLIILGWMMLLEELGPQTLPGTDFDARPVLVLLGVAVVFLGSPLMIRYLWDTQPLPEGELRDRLIAMCRRHDVGVRELLLWRTFGGMINAAVMGLVAPLRYILLTDALLETVRRPQVEAVMAHELAHVRRHHMFWLLVAAVGTLGLLMSLFGIVFVLIGQALPDPEPAGPVLVQVAGLAGVGWLNAGLGWLNTPEGLIAGSMVCTIAVWALVFGWVSRRIERQADAFAVQHLSTDREHPWRDGRGRVLVDAESASTMIGALEQVAVLNHIAPRRRSWRHGSIAWRQQYLRRIVGQPVDALAIDRQMRWIKLAAGLALALFVGVQVWVAL